MLKILIVDDSGLFRGILKRLLQEDYNIVGEAADGNKGFEMYQQHQPNITLLDITMPNCDGIECLSMILKSDPNAKVIMISSISDQNTLQKCLELGAVGYINKKDLNVVNEDGSQKVLIELQKISGDSNEVVV